MLPQTRALIAAAAHAYISGGKVAGVHDHGSGRDLRIAAEARGGDLQGYDGDRSTPFGGTLPSSTMPEAPDSSRSRSKA